MFRQYMRLFLFCAALLVGVQLPTFVDQYGKALQAHYLESERTLLEFRQDAQMFFQGDLNALANYYMAQNDEIIARGGQNIQTLLERNQLLRQAWLAFQSSTPRAFYATYLSPIEDVRQEAWNSYSFLLKLDALAIGCGLFFALALALCFDLICSVIIAFAHLIGSPQRSKRRTMDEV